MTSLILLRTTRFGISPVKAALNFEDLINIRDRTIPFLSRQFKRFEANTKNEKKAVGMILDRLDEMEPMFDLFVNTVDEHPRKSSLSLVDRVVPELPGEQRLKAGKARKPMSIRHFFGGRSAAIAIFSLIEELILYSECRFVEQGSEVSQHHTDILREAWQKGLGNTEPETILLHLHASIRGEICYLSKNNRRFQGF